MFQGEGKQFRRGAIENRDRFGRSVTGISLTTDNTKWPWGNPPDDVDVNTVLDRAAGRLEEDPVFRQEMLKLMLAGVSIEHIVETWVIDNFENGRFSLDVGLLAKGPLGVYLAYVAEQEGVPYRMFERDDPEADRRIDDETYFELMKTNNPAMFQKIREAANKVVRDGVSAVEKRQKVAQEPQPEPEGFMNEEIQDAR